MRTKFHRTPGLVAVLAATLACSGDGPTAARHVPRPSRSQTSVSSTYTFSLDCRKDASLAGNVGLTVFDGGFQTLFIGALGCDQSVTVGPGAIWMHYNINVYDGFDYLFSCENGVGEVPVAAGKYRCTVRDAAFIGEEQKGIWVSLTVKPE